MEENLGENKNNSEKEVRQRPVPGSFSQAGNGRVLRSVSQKNDTARPAAQSTDAGKRPDEKNVGDDRREMRPDDRKKVPANNKAPSVKKKGIGVKTVVGRVFISLGALIGVVLFAVIVGVSVLANGPSEGIRNILVLSAKQASATKWAPGIFLPQSEIDEILENSKKKYLDVTPMPDPPSKEEKEDEWKNAVDGILFETINMPTCKAYVLLIKDPSRVFCGVSSENFATSTEGMRFGAMAEKYGAVAMINGGEFLDTGGTGDGRSPMGLTWSRGKLVWNDGPTKKTFVGFDSENRLYVNDGITVQDAEKLGIRDGVCFQYGNALLTNDGENVIRYYANWDTSVAQRTAIGQRADGTVIMIVTDGRTASSVGATHNDMVDIMVQYGAVTASKLDGGSSAMMYYRDYFDIYNYDKSTLDQYQLQGLVNKYKAFTNPRRLPTYFIVGASK